MDELSSATRVSRQPPRASYRGPARAAEVEQDFQSREISYHDRGPRRFAAGQSIYTYGTAGTAWRLTRGSVRLDRLELKDDKSFAHLAIEGDIIGAETLLFGKYTFTATALTPCLLEPWPEGSGAPSGESLLLTLARAERRASEVVALRCGLAAERVRRLISQLASGGQEGANGEMRSAPHQVTLPPRQDMADITALTLETVSRMVSGLRHAGILKPLLGADGACKRCFSVSGMVSAVGTVAATKK